MKLREKTRFIIQAELAEVQTRSRYKATIANFHAHLLPCCTALLSAAKVALMVSLSTLALARRPTDTAMECDPMRSGAFLLLAFQFAAFGAAPRSLSSYHIVPTLP